MGVLHLNPVDLFFLGNLLKHTETHGETWEYLESPKNVLDYSGLKTSLDPTSLRFRIFWKF